MTMAMAMDIGIALPMAMAIATAMAMAMGHMFELFGVESHLLINTIQRIMSNVDKDFDGMTSAQEFYDLLSQKLEKVDRKDVMGPWAHWPMGP